jgi:hypothetical protein
MNQVPSNDGDDDMERRFQSGLPEDDGPSEGVRRAILEHANRMAAEHARHQPGRRGSAMLARRRNAIFGTLAAAVFAGLLVLPILRAPFIPKQSAADLPTTTEALPTPAQEPGPLPGAVGRDEKYESAAGAQPKIAADAVEPKEAPRPASNLQNYASQAKTAAPRTAGAASALPAARDAPPPAAQTAPPPATPPAAPAAARAPAADAAAEISAAPASASRHLARAANSPAERAESLRGAAAAGDVAAVNALLKFSSDVDARDRSGRTALMLAILNGHAEVVDGLLARGADANAVDLSGARPLQMARAGGNREIIDSLLRAGAK